jgi:hypothetical protein
LLSKLKELEKERYETDKEREETNKARAEETKDIESRSFHHAFKKKYSI